MGTRRATAALLLAATLALALPGAARAAEALYTVRAGDTLSGIAADHGLASWQPLYDANRATVADPDAIRIGQQLVIPGADGAAEGAPAPEAALGTVPEGASAGACGYDGWIAATIAEAAAAYGQSACAMLAVAWCESRFDPGAYNPSGAAGLFQFLPGTWRSTPYAASSPYNAWAAANAAGWMWSQGRRNEWVC